MKKLLKNTLIHMLALVLLLGMFAAPVAAASAAEGALPDASALQEEVLPPQDEGGEPGAQPPAPGGEEDDSQPPAPEEETPAEPPASDTDAGAPAEEQPPADAVEEGVAAPDTLPENLLEVARQNGAEAAALLNAIADDEVFLAGVAAVLDVYYGEELNGRLAEFAAAIDVRADELLARYAAAAAERERDAVELGYIPGQVLVVFKDEVPAQVAEQVMEDATAETTGEVLNVIDDPETDIAVMAVAEAPLEQTVEEAVQAYDEDPNVAYAQPMFLYETAGMDGTVDFGPTNDSRLPSQKYLDTIDAPEAWEELDKLAPGQKVRVAMIDNVPNMKHPDLLANVNPALARDFVYGEPQGRTPLKETDGHGTMVAGVMGATGQNGTGIAGVASGINNDYIEIMPLNVHTYIPGEYHYTYADSSAVKLAIEYAANNGARVINIGFYNIMPQQEPPLMDWAVESAVNYATEAGCAVIAPAGNKDDDQPIYFPADYDNVLGVIALRQEGTKNTATTVANYASQTIPPRYGYSNHHKGHISAPGAAIVTTRYASSYATVAATSYATPMVSAVAAMMFYADPTLTGTDVIKILKETAWDIYEDGDDDETGVGCVNAAAAVRKVIANSSGGNAGGYIAAPKNLRVTRVEKTDPVNNKWEIALAWDEVENATGGYAIYATQRSINKFVRIDTVADGTTTYIDTGKRYIASDTDIDGFPGWLDERQYYVVALRGTLASSPSNVAQATTTDAVPQNVRATVDAYNQVTVTWDPVYGIGVKGYDIYRATSENGPYSIVGTSATPTVPPLTEIAPPFVDKTVQCGTTYYYKVKSYVAASYRNVSSEFSDMARALPRLDAVADFKQALNLATPNRVTLRWKQVPGATGYLLYLPGGTTKIITKGTTLSFNHDGVSEASPTYRITPYRNSTTNFFDITTCTATVPKLAAPVIESAEPGTAYNQAVVKWTMADTTGVTGYVLYRGTSATTFDPTPVAVISEKAKITYTDKAAPKGTTHYKLVAYYKIAGERFEGNAAVRPLGSPLKTLGNVTVNTAVPTPSKFHSLDVTWTAGVEGAGGYNVYYCKSGSGDPLTLGKTVSGKSTAKATLTALPKETLDVFVMPWVSVGGKKMEGGCDNTKTATPTPLPSVRDVNAVPTGYYANKITWTPLAKSTGVAGYNIYVEGGDYGLSPIFLTTVKGATAKAYTNTGRFFIDDYEYSVVPIIKAGTPVEDYEGLPSSEAIARPIEVPKVETVTAKENGWHNVRASWKVSASGASGYYVFRLPKGGSFTPTYLSNPNNAIKTVAGTSSTSYAINDAPLEAGSYKYAVVPYHTVGKVKTPVPNRGYIGDDGDSVTPQALNPVTAVRAYPTPGDYASVTVEWDRDLEASGYFIYTDNGTGVFGATPLATVTSGKTVKYKHNGIDAGYTLLGDGNSTVPTFRYKVVAYRTVSGKKMAGGTPGDAMVCSAKPNLLRAVSGISTSTANGNSATISWAQRVGATGYNVYRAIDPNGTYQLVYKAPKGTTTSYVDKGLAQADYYYRVIPCRTVGGKRVEGLRSASYIARAHNAYAPSNFSVKKTQFKNSVTISWGNSAGATGYYIYAKLENSSAPYVKVATVGAKAAKNQSYVLARGSGRWSVYMVPYVKHGGTIYLGSTAGPGSATIL